LFQVAHAESATFGHVDREIGPANALFGIVEIERHLRALPVIERGEKCPGGVGNPARGWAKGRSRGGRGLSETHRRKAGTKRQEPNGENEVFVHEPIEHGPQLKVTLNEKIARTDLLAGIKEQTDPP